MQTTATTGDQAERRANVLAGDRASGCPFCEPDQRLPWNRAILRNSSFYVVPSVGSLVEHWFLAVPMRHQLSLAAATGDERENLVAITREVSKKLIPPGAPVAVFEHGPSKCGDSVGCSVDHAHLHIVATDIDLLEGARRLYPALTWTSGPALSAIEQLRSGSQSYLYLKAPSGECAVARGESLPSQLFRRVIAQALGRTDEWNWRTHPQLEQVMATVTALSSKLTSAPRGGG